MYVNLHYMAMTNMCVSINLIDCFLIPLVLIQLCRSVVNSFRLTVSCQCDSVRSIFTDVCSCRSREYINDDIRNHNRADNIRDTFKL